MRRVLALVLATCVLTLAALALAPQFQSSPAAAIPSEVLLTATTAAPTAPPTVPPASPTAAPAEAATVLTDTAGMRLPALMYQHDPSFESPMGISMYGPVDGDNGLSAMKEAGAKWVITYIRWAEIQPTGPTDFNWASTDGNFARAAAAGLKIHALFDVNPTWVTDNPRGPVPADKLDELEAIVTAMASRYNGQNGQPRVDHWSFYGEPDSNISWGTEPYRYAAMLARVAPIIRAHNPNAVILLSGLAYDKFTDDTVNPPGPFVRSFLTTTLQALNANHGGAATHLDQVGFNYYPISLSRWPTIREKAAEIRAIMTQHGVGHLPLAVTEMSMWSVWPAHLGGENQAQQAHYLVHFYTRGLSVGIRQLYWFQVFDVFPAYDGSTQGLFVGEGVPALSNPKQSYFAYKTLAAELDQARFSNVLNVPGTEGYVFRRGAERITVVWGASQTPALVEFAQGCARRVNVTGTQVTQIADGGAGDLDGSANGRIRLQVIFEQPVYVTACR